MLIVYTAHTKTGTAAKLDKLFASHVEQIIENGKDLLTNSGDPDRPAILVMMEEMKSRITNNSPIEFVEFISWSWQTEDHEILGGASGRSTIYVNGNIDTQTCGIYDVLIDRPGDHLSLKVEVTG